MLTGGYQPVIPIGLVAAPVPEGILQLQEQRPVSPDYDQIGKSGTGIPPGITAMENQVIISLGDPDYFMLKLGFCCHTLLWRNICTARSRP